MLEPGETPPSDAAYFDVEDLIDWQVANRVRGGREKFTAVMSTNRIGTTDQIAILSTGDPAITALGIAAPGNVVATRMRRVRFHSVTPIPHLPCEDIFSDVPTRNQRWVRRTLMERGGDELTDASWREIRNVILSHDEPSPQILQDLESQLWNQPVEYPGSKVLRDEKDAVEVAIRIANIDPHQVSEISHDPESGHFLEGLDQAEFIEDQLLQHDATHFLDWAEIGVPAPAAHRFSDGDKTLIVMNVNRTDIEETTGVDLVYYNETYDAFILVQYKRMQNEDGDIRYRPSSDQTLEKEIARMEEIQSLAEEGSGLDGYRLDDGPCYLKICQPGGFRPGESKLVKGMYFPLDYWRRVCTDDSTTGPQGGTVISYETVRRYLTNTQFFTVVEDAWVGSAGDGSAKLHEVLRKALEGDRASILAIEPDVEQE